MPRPGPTRRQKRWSGPLRTGGALAGMLGLMALADVVTGAADPLQRTSITAFGLLASLGGLAVYLFGRRWTA